MSPFYVLAKKTKVADISDLISEKEFISYQHVGEFIENSPKVSVLVLADEQDKATYGADVKKSLTGSDCDRDGKMDDNATCNAVYLKLWLKYSR
jgi:hypothetical protein